MADISKIKALDGVTYNIKDAAAARTSHSHGNITSDGLISSDTTAASGDKLILADSSASGKVIRSGITLSSAINPQTTSSKFLREDGVWATPSYVEVIKLA